MALTCESLDVWARPLFSCVFFFLNDYNVELRPGQHPKRVRQRAGSGRGRQVGSDVAIWLGLCAGPLQKTCELLKGQAQR
jgi:hypothetical protein